MADNKEKNEITRKNLIATFIGLSVFFILISLIGFLFEPQLRKIAEIFASQFGMLGLSLLVFWGDFFVSPIPPEIALLIIFNSSLHEDWFLNVTLIAISSLLAGQAGWLGGKYLARRKWVPRWIRILPHKHKSKLRKYGTLIVVLGAVTPIPFSLTCWAAGFVRLNYGVFFLATLTRLPRVYGAYWLISTSDTIRNLF